MADEKKPAAKAAAKPAAKAAAPKAAAEKPAAKAAAPKAAAKPAAEKAPAKAAAKPAAEKAPAKAAAPKAAAAEKTEAAAPKAAAPKAAAKPAAKKAAAPREKSTLLKLHHLRPADGSKKDRTRVGRGEGSKGKTSGRGTKGTKARYQVRPGFEGGGVRLVMRTPKLRGFKNPAKVYFQVVNVVDLEALYPKGGNVTVADLVAKGAVRKNEPVKVLGNGDISVKLTVSVDKVSRSAAEKIVAAGGSVSE
jgi:large subunit ribosomal protein L15